MTTNFYIDVIQRDPRYLSAEPVNDIALLEPGFRAKAQRVVDDAYAKGIELVSTETYRSSERQQRLYDEGKTRLRVVGVHHYGLAIDFVKLVNGKQSYDGDWTFLCALAASAGIVSGGDWGLPDKPHSFRDWDHLQGVTIAQQGGLFAGSYYPGADGTGTTAPIPADLAAPKAALPAVPAGLSLEQAKILALADKANVESFAGWFKRSWIMAFVEVESEFNERAYRREPSGVASYGVMQVLDSTAAGLGLTGSAEQMYDPAVSLFYGMKYAAGGYNYLRTHLGRPPSTTEWCEGYNEGYGAAAAFRRDPGYSAKWLPAEERWAALLGTAASAPPPIVVTTERRVLLRRAADRTAYGIKPPVEKPAPPEAKPPAVEPEPTDSVADDLMREELARIALGLPEPTPQPTQGA